MKTLRVGAGVAVLPDLGKMTEQLESPRRFLEIQGTEAYHRPNSEALWVSAVKKNKQTENNSPDDSNVKSAKTRDYQNRLAAEPGNPECHLLHFLPKT